MLKKKKKKKGKRKKTKKIKRPNVYRTISQTGAAPVARYIPAVLLVSNLKQNANCKLFCKILLARIRRNVDAMCSYLLFCVIIHAIHPSWDNILEARLASFSQPLSLQSTIYWHFILKNIIASLKWRASYITHKFMY